jgi:hypothetical protein
VFGLAIFKVVIALLILFAVVALSTLVTIQLAPLILLFYGGGPLIFLAFSLFLLWGNNKMVWWAYILEVCSWVSTVVVNFVSTVMFFILGLAFMLLNFEFYERIRREHGFKQEGRVVVAGYIMFIALLSLFFSLIHLYFTCVVLRDFQYVYKFGRRSEPPPPKYY